MRLVLFIALLATALPAAALRNNTFHGYLDPEFVGYQPTKIIVLVNAAPDFREKAMSRLTRDFAKYGVTVVDHFSIFPPTREMPEPDVLIATLEQHGIDAALFIGIGAYDSAVTYGGSISSANANAWSSGNNAYATGSSTSVPIYNTSSRGEYTYELTDVKTGLKAYQATLVSKAGGSFFTNVGSETHAVVKQLRIDLEKKGILRK